MISGGQIAMPGAKLWSFISWVINHNIIDWFLLMQLSRIKIWLISLELYIVTNSMVTLLCNIYCHSAILQWKRLYGAFEGENVKLSTTCLSHGHHCMHARVTGNSSTSAVTELVRSHKRWSSSTGDEVFGTEQLGQWFGNFLAYIYSTPTWLINCYGF